MKLSHSAIDTFVSCGEKYRLHYIEKLRGKTTSSPLVFGGAIDAALNALLLRKKKNLSEEEMQIANSDPLVIFEEKFKTADINGTIFNIQVSDKIEYSNKDFDVATLGETDVTIVNGLEVCPYELQFDQIESFKMEVQKTLKNEAEISTELLLTYNAYCWRSMLNKGKILISAYEKFIMPRIIEVHSIQDEVALSNSSGDLIRGFVDYVATFDDNIKRVMDNKTSADKYPKTKIQDTPQQLTIYAEHLGIKDVGYSVLIKKINKKKPEEQVQLLFGEITENMQNQVFSDIGETLLRIKNEEFDKNFESCYKYYKKCPYYSLCRGTLEKECNNIERIKEEK